MAAAMKQAISEAITGVTSSKKVVDLQSDIVDPTGGMSYQNTDHGVKIKDPDNWLVLSNYSVFPRLTSFLG